MMFKTPMEDRVIEALMAKSWADPADVRALAIRVRRAMEAETTIATSNIGERIPEIWTKL